MNPLLTSWPGPLLIFLVTLLLALLAYILHRLSFVSGLIAALGCLALGWVCVHQASESPMLLFGREWVLSPSFALWGQEWALTQPVLAVLTFIFFVSGLAFLLALPTSQGWAFYPFGLGALAILTLAIMAQQYPQAILFLWLAANLSVFVLSGGRPGATTGALRFLILTSIGVMPLLILPRYLESGPTGEVMQAATILPIISFGILLMMVPFHGKLVAIVAHSGPMVPAFALSAFPPVVLYMLSRVGQIHPGFLSDPLFFGVCHWLGLAAVAMGGLAALGQREWGHLIGYATLVDWGAGLIALGQGTASGMEQIVQMLFWRALSLLLAGTGLNMLFRATGKRDDMRQCAGLLCRRPLAVLALAAGMLSLAAFPLTPGAAGRWPLIQTLLDTNSQAAWVLILAGVGVSVGTLIALRTCFGPTEGVEQPPAVQKRDRLEALLSVAFVALAFWIVGTLFLHPTPWLDLTSRMLGDLWG